MISPVAAAWLLSHDLLFCNPMDCSPPGSFVQGISQARILEWVVISFSRGSSPPRDQIHISCVSCIAVEFFTTKSSGKPYFIQSANSVYASIPISQFIPPHHFPPWEKEIQKKRGDIYVYKADSLCCRAETNSTL